MEIALPVGDAVGRLQNRLHAELASAVDEWSSFVSTLTKWEDDHLLNNPAPELLADHKAALERFLAFGSFISRATEVPGFPDRRTADLVTATQMVLRDKLRMWHAPRMSDRESESILLSVFPDEP